MEEREGSPLVTKRGMKREEMREVKEAFLQSKMSMEKRRIAEEKAGDGKRRGRGGGEGEGEGVMKRRKKGG